MAISNIVEHEGLLYETDEKGQRTLVRSIESNLQVLLRFSNKTSRPVDVWWRNFNGSRKHYLRLSPGNYRDVNSYLTHPWEFTDGDTQERYVINNMPIYRSPTNLGGMRYRTNWNITVSVRTLRATVLLALAVHLKNPSLVDSLGLPRILADELKELIEVINRPRDPSPAY